jgi:hypothetical protein
MKIGFVFQGNQRVSKNVVRGFSLVPHDPEGSHYKIWGANTFRVAMNERKTNLDSQLIQEANGEVEKEIEETKKSL